MIQTELPDEGSIHLLNLRYQLRSDIDRLIGGESVTLHAIQFPHYKTLNLETGILANAWLPWTALNHAYCLHVELFIGKENFK